MSFLPENYEKPESNSRYYKFIKGDNVFRILSNAIVGWIDWENKKPIRTREMPEVSIDPSKPAKHFWAFAIWDYREKTIKILEITQSGIQNTILGLHQDADWGDPKNYDLKVVRSGDGLETKYEIRSAPPRPINQEVQELYKKTYIQLENLYDGEDPFDQNYKLKQPMNIPEAQEYPPMPDDSSDVDVSKIPF